MITWIAVVMTRAHLNVAGRVGVRNPRIQQFQGVPLLREVHDGVLNYAGLDSFKSALKTTYVRTMSIMRERTLT